MRVYMEPSVENPHVGAGPGTEIAAVYVGYNEEHGYSPAAILWALKSLKGGVSLVEKSYFSDRNDDREGRVFHFYAPPAKALQAAHTFVDRLLGVEEGLSLDPTATAPLKDTCHVRQFQEPVNVSVEGLCT